MSDRPSLNKALIKFRNIPTPTTSGFYIEAIENGTIKLSRVGNPTCGNAKYRVNSQELFNTYEYGTDITLNAGEKCYFSITNSTTNFSSSNYLQFSSTMKINAGGTISSLIGNAVAIPRDYCFFSLFKACSGLISIEDLQLIDSLNGKGYCYSSMFFNCANLTTLNNKLLEATELTYGCYATMFGYCSSLTAIPNYFLPATILAGTCYNMMFYNCTSLETIPADLFPATYMPDSCYASMFSNCSALKVSETETGAYNIPFRMPTTGTGTQGSNPTRDMFRYTGGTFTGTPLINTTYYLCSQDPTGTYRKIVDNGDNTTTVYLRGREKTGYDEYTGGEISGSAAENAKIVSIVTEGECILPANCRNMFQNCVGLTELDVSDFNTSNVTNMGQMFYSCSQLTSLDLSPFDTSGVTDMSYMFNYCSNLTSLDVSSFETSNVTTMYSMFTYCSGLTELDVSNFDVSKVTTMNNMFSSCSGLTSLDLSSFVPSNATHMVSMFNGCSNLTSLNLSNFDTSKVGYMSSMFAQCGSLTSLDLSSFNTSRVSTTVYMFNGCISLEHIYASDTWNLSGVSVGNTANMFNNCVSLHNFDSSYVDKTRAIIDDGTNHGYLERL